ncbi:RdRP domain-containing protein [Cephalotus follicularis]|uniref:RNA-dependent RNA polymerase n=1 Tax=Cephalotus follicularis TaxID=3775 RepID=A0A1Q3B4T7_CEPFO|nr:RdRP domain-containing protein [Cephalotus follicularis]
MDEEIERPTVRMTNIPQTAIAKDLLEFLESQLGPDSVFAIEISTDRNNWKPRSYGRIQFTTLEFKSKAQHLSRENKLTFKSHNLKIEKIYDDIIHRPIKPLNMVDGGALHVGFLAKDNFLYVLESWEGVRAWVMPERRKVEFWVWQNEECYKVEVMFEDVLEAVGCCLAGDTLNALLLKLKYVPRIYQKISGPNIKSKFCTDRYHICKEDFDFVWVRTTDFSIVKSFGQSTSFCWEIEDGLSVSEIFSCFPFYKEEMKDLIVDDGVKFCSASEIVPLVKCELDPKLAFEILFQLNSLVHTQKISLAGAGADLIKIFSSLDIGTANIILQNLHKMKSICYDPMSFVKCQLHDLKRSCKHPPLSSQQRLADHNVMSCHRALVTPSKIYCLGPELETSNYVVKHFAEYASDFIRVTFVEEDWSKLPANAICTSIQRGTFSKPFRTEIYHRILSVLRNGIVIGPKRYEFLAFSASQLRSNSVWMFASNDKVKAEEIREWMGCFNNIRSVAKCAARMGQLFSSSKQTMVVPVQDVEIIPDIEVTSDGFDYCFSDGIGKISLSFARQVAEKCGLSHTPSAFQIRYGGYKGVIAVDRNSFRKLSLRGSMLKYESKNRMLNVTSWSEPTTDCFLNREIVSLLSTLGIKDEVFEAMQQEQLHLLGKMLTNREAALDVLQKMGGYDSKNILVKMLLQGYEPNVEPYLSMLLQVHHESLLSDLKSRCRIYVPKGRVLIGCLDETGILNYGRVFIRVTMRKAELECEDQSFFRKVDGTTSVITGKVIVTRNPCLHPGDVRVLEAVYEVVLEEKGLVDCIVFPQKGDRPHPNECSGGDLDGDKFFISWDKDLIPSETEPAMNYTGCSPRIMEHDVTLEEIQKFFVDYMINDTLGAISTAHLVLADREPNKARSKKCLHLAALHSMAVDFAKTGAPAMMPNVLKPKEFPDFMERVGKRMYTSPNVLGKLYRSILDSKMQERPILVWSDKIAEATYDCDLELNGFEAFLDIAEGHKDMYVNRMNTLMNYYGAETEDEILTGNLRNKAMYIQRDNRRYGEMKDRILESIRCLQKEAKKWFESSCKVNEHQLLASAWYHVTYHPSYYRQGWNCLSLPWIVGDILLNIKSFNSRKSSA